MLEILRGDVELEKGLLLKNFVNLTQEELEKIRMWRNHPEVRRWMYTDHEISKEEHFNFVEKLKRDTRNFYYLVIKEGRAIGVIYLIRLDLRNRNAYFGIYANPEDKVLGAGVVLGTAVLKLVFEVLGLHTLKLEVFESNLRAFELYKKLGFKEEGRLREFVFKDGRWLDVIVMGMTEEEYYEKYKNRG